MNSLTDYSPWPVVEWPSFCFQGHKSKKTSTKPKKVRIKNRFDDKFKLRSDPTSLFEAICSKDIDVEIRFDPILQIENALHCGGRSKRSLAQISFSALRKNITQQSSFKRNRLPLGNVSLSVLLNRLNGLSQIFKYANVHAQPALVSDLLWQRVVSANKALVSDIIINDGTIHFRIFDLFDHCIHQIMRNGCITSELKRSRLAYWSKISPILSISNSAEGEYSWRSIEATSEVVKHIHENRLNQEELATFLTNFFIKVVQILKENDRKDTSDASNAMILISDRISDDLKTATRIAMNRALT